MEYGTEFFSALLDHLDIGVFVLDTNGTYVYGNHAYYELVCKPREFFSGVSISALKQQGYLTHSVWEQVMQQGKPVYSVVTITDRLLNRSYNTLTGGFPFYDDEGVLRFVFCTQEKLTHLSRRLQQGMMNKAVNIDAGSGEDTADKPVDIIAESPQMKQLLALLDTVSKTDASVLVSGPSGSGKEVIAHYIHRSSSRKGKPFVVLNCAAIPESLMEAELFGYEKGAFTGASAGGKPGLIEAAHGGTLFLDEINSMPIALQSKLLRVLETRHVTRLGSVNTKEIDFRLVCASNENLQTLVSERRFRSDLFYRINVISVLVPPLRERKEDIVPLALHYLRHYCEKYSRVKVFSEQALNTLQGHRWPGNVRELKNLVERLVVTSPQQEWQIDSLALDDGEEKIPHFHQGEDALPPSLPLQDEAFSFRAHMDHCERTLLEQAFRQLHTPAAVAEALKLDLSNVYRKAKKHHIRISG